MRWFQDGLIRTGRMQGKQSVSPVPGRGADFRKRFQFTRPFIIQQRTMKDTDPISIEEMKEASSVFFPLLEVVKKGMPEGCSTEDTLKVMEHVTSLAQRLRKQKKRDQAQERFGLVPNFKGSYEP